MKESIKKRIEAVRSGEVPEGYSVERAMLYPNDWGEPVPLNTVLTENKDRNEDLRFGKDDVLSVSGEQGVVNQIELLGRSYAGESVAPYHVVETGDVVYTKSPLKENPYGIIKQNRGVPGIVSTLYAVYHCTSPITGQYLENYFCIDTYLNNYLKPLVKRGAKNDMKVNNEDVLLGRIPFPSLSEQERINEIISQFDRVIELKQQLLEEKRRQKQWLMQKLLDPNSGVRLSGFEGSEWYTVTLDEYCDCLDTLRKPVNAQQREKMQGSYPYWGANSIQGYVNDYLFDEEIVLLAEDGGYFDDFKTKPIAVYVNEKCWVNNHAHILRAKNGNTKLLYFILVHKDIRNYINGTTRSKLTRGDMMSISIILPKNAQEQKRLIEVLTACETEIELSEQELAAWQQKKKALMQLLLTGLVRVNA